MDKIPLWNQRTSTSSLGEISFCVNVKLGAAITLQYTDRECHGKGSVAVQIIVTLLMSMAYNPHGISGKESKKKWSQ